MSREQVNGPDDGKSISASAWQASVSRQSRTGDVRAHITAVE